MMGNC